MVVLSAPRVGLVEKAGDKALVEDLYRTSQRFREVWDDITRQYGAINVMETTDRTHFDRGTIFVNRDAASHARKAAIAFEVTNAYQNQRIFQIQRDFPASDLSAEDYATAIERVEYEGTLLHSQMMREGIEGGQWPSSMDLFGNLADYAAAHGNAAAFAQYLASQKRSGHFGRYVEQALHPRNVKTTKVEGSLADLVREGHF
jgi:hypothetical protein